MSDNRREDVVILGAGLAGLSAGHALSEAGLRAALVEAGATVGGMSRTEIRDGYRFDLGGHRFFTTDGKIEDFVNQLMGAEMLTVPRKSKIYLRNRYFEYPLKPFNALFGLGWAVTAKILIDYGTAAAEGSLEKGAGYLSRRSCRQRLRAHPLQPVFQGVQREGVGPYL